MSDPRSEIIETTTRMAVLTDARQWDELITVFAPIVRLDYTALFGGRPAQLEPLGVVDGWARALAHLTTQHLVTNHLVTIAGNAATVTASFQATHVASSDRQPWVLGGDYRYELVHHDDRWWISSVTLTPRWETGDRSILGPTE
jgi:hypothetical protein